MKKITIALILLLSVLIIGIKKTNAFELREVDTTVHTGKIISLKGLQQDVSDWHRLNVDINLKADVYQFSKFATIGVTLTPTMNFAEDLNVVNFTGGVYINPFNSRHIEIYYRYTDAYDVRNKLAQEYSFSNNEAGIRFILMRR